MRWKFAKDAEFMNVLLMNSVAVDSWGGGEKWMLTTGNGLRERGYKIYFSGRKNSLFLERCAEWGFPTLPLSIKSDFSIKNILELADFYRKNNIDVALVNFNKDVRLAGLAAKISRRPLVVPMNGLPILHNNWRYRMTFKLLVDGIITNTHAIKNRYLSYGWLEEDFIRVIHNGIETDVAADFDNKKTRKKYNLPAQSPAIGIFGRLVKQKQHKLFLEVAKNVLKKSPDTIFLIVGEGPERDTIRQYASELGILDNVHMLGMQQDIYPLYACCDLILLTSDDEGIPNVIIEAMLMERPVISFNVGGMSEAIPTDNVGILIPPNDVGLMTQKTLELLTEPDRCASIGKAARKFIQENFSMEKMIDGTGQYIKDLQARKSGI